MSTTRRELLQAVGLSVPLVRQPEPVIHRAWEAMAQALLPQEARRLPHRTMLEWWDREIGTPLWSKQREIMESVERNRYTAVASCHGIGKSYLSSRIVEAFLHTREDSIVLTTAPTFSQVEQVIWRDIRAVANEHPEKIRGRVLTTRHEIGPNWYALGFKPADNETDRLQGFHARSGNILVVIDEAAGVPDRMIDVLHATMTSSGARFLMIGNPTSITGRFREAFHEHRDTYHTITIPASSTPNFTGESDEPHLRHLREVLITPEFVAEEIRLHGLESDYVQSRIFAQWPTGSTNRLIPLADLEATEKASGELATATGRYYAGVDVARFGDDESSLSVRYGQEEIAFAAWHGNDTVESANLVEAIFADLERRGWANLRDEIEVRVDTIGVGAGVADQLRHRTTPSGRRYTVRGVAVSEASSDRTQWKNLRHELWWQLKTLYAERRIAPARRRVEYEAGTVEGATVAARWDRRMMGQLSDVLYSYEAGYTKPVIEDKARTKQRTGHSPDRAEAQLLCYGQLPRRAAPLAVAQGRARTKR